RVSGSARLVGHSEIRVSYDKFPSLSLTSATGTRHLFMQAAGGKNKNGRLAPPRSKTDHRSLATDHCYVPSLHPAKYSSCSGVSRSILIPTDSSFSLATRLSSSSGT